MACASCGRSERNHEGTKGTKNGRSRILPRPQDLKTSRPQDPKTPRPQDPKTPRPQDPKTPSPASIAALSTGRAGLRTAGTHRARRPGAA
ncbi:MAG: hypothetical protein IT177_07110 [Acidobacteria bacterium]|nr:hypothetical protein [Acidobacteriota bacterium]